MTWVIFFFGTGLAYFTGVGLQLLAIVNAWRWRGKWLSRIITLLSVFGLILVLLSAAPLPYWLYAIAFTSSLAWLGAERLERLARIRRPLRWLAGGVWLLALLWELPHQLSPNVPQLGKPRLVLVGDSVAAGAGESGVTPWPALMAREHSLEMLDLSHPGAKVRSAAKRVGEQLLRDDDFVLLEIGGNDVLGGTPVADFERGLEGLLSRVCGSNRFVLMFELPTPPFCNDYGLTQRRLAVRHGVRLIPKRILIGVITGDGATIDSIHLTTSGHKRMAEAVWSVIGAAYEH
ncbi:MAG: hypothetical protein HY040_26320 [Planctomycetes bacterium]|nr:hypothetical protein [Planctomycetota bacterium]